MRDQFSISKTPQRRRATFLVRTRIGRSSDLGAMLLGAYAIWVAPGLEPRTMTLGTEALARARPASEDWRGPKGRVVVEADDEGVTIVKQGKHLAFGPLSARLRFADVECRGCRGSLSVALAIASEAWGRCWLIGRATPLHREARAVCDLISARCARDESR